VTFEEKILKESKSKEAKLLRAAKKAVKEPDTGVKILKKSAYYVIRDCAKIAELYLPHLIYSQIKNPIQMLEGVFSRSEVSGFVSRAKKDLVTNQLLNLIVLDIKKQNLLESATTAPPQILEFEDVEEDDIYGDYDSEPVSGDIETEVVVEVEKDTLQLLLDAFKVTN